MKSEEEIRIALQAWYLESLSGNSGPLIALCNAISTFFLFDLVSDSLYDYACEFFDSGVIPSQDQEGFYVAVQ